MENFSLKGKKQPRKRQRTRILLSEKKQILEIVKDERSRGLSWRKIGKKLDVGHSTLREIAKNESKIMEKLEEYPTTDATV